MKYLFAILCALCAFHCQHPPAKQNLGKAVDLPQSAVQDTVICPGKMHQTWPDSLPADLFAPKNRELVCGSYGWYMPDDTITLSGNFVKYLISNDTCCRDYLYLNWGNAKFHRTENLGELRQFHPKMNPWYVGENDQYLFLEGAANGGLPIIGWMLWVFPLDSGLQSNSHTMVAYDAYDPKSMTIVREVDSENQTEHYAFEAYNIRAHRVKPIRFKNRILMDMSPLCMAIDSISVTPRTIFLRVNAYDKNDKEVQEVVILPNDIK